MRIGLLICSTVLVLSGCFSHVKTADIDLDYRPTHNLSIGLKQNNINVFHGSCMNKIDLFSALILESKGQITESANQPLVLSVDIDFRPRFRNNHFLGITSFFIPFLMFIPESNNEFYSVTYTINDKHGKSVFQNNLHGTVEGTMWGWYIGRIHARNQLVDQEAMWVGMNSARLILMDIYKNSGKLQEAAMVVNNTP